jgi:hypothetical protein
VTPHNHVRPLESRPVARCGGPGLCRQCHLEQVAAAALEAAYPEASDTLLRVMLDDLLRMLPMVH